MAVGRGGQVELELRIVLVGRGEISRAFVYRFPGGTGVVPKAGFGQDMGDDGVGQRYCTFRFVVSLVD